MPWWLVTGGLKIKLYPGRLQAEALPGRTKSFYGLIPLCQQIL